MPPTPKLRIIQGGQSSSHRIGSIEVIPATLHAQAGPLEVRVLEEDTWQVMGSETVLHETETHPIRIMTDLIEQQALKVGDVLVRGRQWLAVVYDLDHEPICEAEWIKSALQKILVMAEQKEVSALALPLLGCAHGPISGSQSMEIMIRVLDSHAGKHLQRIWLLVNEDQLQAVQRVITAQ